jgi:hypothetical protein
MDEGWNLVCFKVNVRPTLNECPVMSNAEGGLPFQSWHPIKLRVIKVLIANSEAG